MENNKKLILLKVLNILRDFSDEDHNLTYSDIRSKLNAVHGISPNVKTIANNIDTLIADGYEIEKVGNRGCFLRYRDFEKGELFYLVDAINSSKAISYLYAKDLIERLTRNESVYDRKKYKPVQKDEISAKNYNTDLFYIIEVLSDAIEQEKQVEFNYNYYTIEKEKKAKNDGKIYKINPYHLVNSNGRYYLICNNDKYNDISNYRVENISNIKILDYKTKDILSLNNMENFNLKDYMQEHIYMTFGKIIKATIKINNERQITNIVDWFGQNIKIEKNEDDILITLNVNENALLYWAMQYGEHVEIVKPKESRNKIKKMLDIIIKKYE